MSLPQKGVEFLEFNRLLIEGTIAGPSRELLDQCSNQAQEFLLLWSVPKAPISISVTWPPEGGGWARA